MSDITGSSYHTNDADTPKKIQPERKTEKGGREWPIKASLKKSAHIKHDEESRQSLITAFLHRGEESHETMSISKQNFDRHSYLTNLKLKEFDEKLQSKDREIENLRSRCNEEHIKMIACLEENHKFRSMKAQSLKKLADINRKERATIDTKRFGYFLSTKNGGTFVEGQLMITLKEEIKSTKERVKKLQLEKKGKQVTSSEFMNLQSAFNFFKKELSEMQKELEYRESEVKEYQIRLIFSKKEAECKYSLENWPVIYERYQTLEYLGGGGFGDVYKCYDIEHDKIVAIKLFRFNGIRQSQRQEYFKHAQREANIQKSLRQENIAKLEEIIEIDRQKDTIVFQIEYCSGPELSKYMKKHGTIPEKEAKVYIKQILSAVHHLYDRNEKIIHYDLKPSNIMFHDGVIKLVDFGLCKIMENQDETRIDLTSQGCGTYYYLPPETFEQYEPKINSKVDVWSVGIIFYEMLFGKRPFGDGMKQMELMRNDVILKAKKIIFPPQECKRLRVSEAARDFISDCTRYDSGERMNPTEALHHAYFNKLT